MLTVPQQPPALSTTGKLVARCSWSFRRASSTGSSASQQADEGRMISSTRTSEARRSSAATPQHTSRSVTTPASLRFSVSSTTGAQPQPESRIARAACATVSCGVQQEDASIGFITSLQQPIFFSSFSFLRSQFNQRGAVRNRGSIPESVSVVVVVPFHARANEHHRRPEL